MLFNQLVAVSVDRAAKFVRRDGRPDMAARDTRRNDDAQFDVVSSCRGSEERDWTIFETHELTGHQVRLAAARTTIGLHRQSASRLKRHGHSAPPKINTPGVSTVCFSPVTGSILTATTVPLSPFAVAAGIFVTLTLIACRFLTKSAG